MAQQAKRQFDERFNELSDKDAFWGPLVGFRPLKERCIGNLRAMTVAGMLGGVYGMLLNLALSLICRHSEQRLPHVLLMPAILTLTYFAAFQLTLGPAWNRRARLLVRRADYLASVGSDRAH